MNSTGGRVMSTVLPSNWQIHKKMRVYPKILIGLVITKNFTPYMVSKNSNKHLTQFTNGQQKWNNFDFGNIIKFNYQSLKN